MIQRSTVQATAVQGWYNLVKGVQCYELFGVIVLRNHTFLM